MATFPSFYDRNKVGTFYTPDVLRVHREAANVHNVPFASEDKIKVLLLLVDEQVDFVLKNGALSVPGAVEDATRLIEWIYRNISKITQIAGSLDSHIPIQIFFPSWWSDDRGNHPDPFTAITSADIQSGKWFALYEPEWSLQYVELLEQQAKKVLMIWPYHTLIGTPGHNLVPALYEAVAYHGAVRGTQPYFLTKGTIPKTEHYSILEPEVKVPEDPNGDLNVPFLDFIGSYDLIYIAGQAKSHCVLETVTSVMRYFSNRPDVIGKLRFMMDCMSSVAHPDIDFDSLANAQFDIYRNQGAQFVDSTSDIR